MQRGQAGVLIIVGILVVVVIVGGAYFLGMSRNTSPVPQPAPQIVKPQPTPASESTSSAETANWKTYTNNIFKYSFQYPPTLAVSNCPSYDCGEIIYYPKAPGKTEIDENNSLGHTQLIGGRYCYDEKFKSSTNSTRASLQAQCDLPGVQGANDPILPVVDEQIVNASSGLSQYSFYLQEYKNSKLGSFHAFFFTKPITETNINKEVVTYYGIYWTANPLKSLTTDKISLFNQILSTFKFLP